MSKEWKEIVSKALHKCETEREFVLLIFLETQNNFIKLQIQTRNRVSKSVELLKWSTLCRQLTTWPMTQEMIILENIIFIEFKTKKN